MGAEYSTKPETEVGSDGHGPSEKAGHSVRTVYCLHASGEHQGKSIFSQAFLKPTA